MNKRGLTPLSLLAFLALVTFVASWLVFAAGGSEDFLPSSRPAPSGIESSVGLDRLTSEIRRAHRVLVPETGKTSGKLLLLAGSGQHVGYYLDTTTGTPGVVKRAVYNSETGKLEDEPVLAGVRSLVFKGIDERIYAGGAETVTMEITLEVKEGAVWIAPVTYDLNVRIPLKTPWWRLVTR